MPEQSHPMDHVDRRQIVLHEIRSSKVQNVQIVDGVQFFLRRMQPGDWSGAFRYMRAVAAQVHRVAQAPKRAAGLSLANRYGVKVQRNGTWLHRTTGKAAAGSANTMKALP